MDSGLTRKLSSVIPAVVIIQYLSLLYAVQLLDHIVIIFIGPYLMW